MKYPERVGFYKLGIVAHSGLTLRQTVKEREGELERIMSL